MSYGIMKRGLDDGYNDNMDPKRLRGTAPGIDIRILLPSNCAGAVIGKGGSTIKRLRADYNASVTVPDSMGPERILSIGAERNSALNCLHDVLPNLDEHGGGEEMETEIRVLVHQSQAGCIIGRGGAKIKELRERTGSNIKVFANCCPQSSDRVVQLTGTPTIIINALHEILDLMDTAPPKGQDIPYNANNFDEAQVQEYGGYTQGEGGGKGRGGGRGGMNRGGGQFGMGGGGGYGGSRYQMDDFSDDGPPSAMFGRGGMMGGGGYGGGGYGRGYGGGFGGRGGGMRNMGGGRGGYGGFNPTDFDQETRSGTPGMYGNQEAKLTTKVTVPKDCTGAIIGKGGNRIAEIRRQAGARIGIEDPPAGSDESIITITGTEEQIQNARYLLQTSVRKYSGKFN